jgi:hypothetical protein
VKGHGDLRLAVTAAGFCALVAVFVPVVPIRILAAVPLTLFLPGFALTAAFFPRREPDWMRRAALEVGLSLVVLVFGALLLTLFPGGIRTGWWALLLFAVVFFGCRAAARRRTGRPRLLDLRLPRLRAPQAALLGAGVLATVAALVLAFVPLGAGQVQGYTEMWIRPLTKGAKTGVEIGVGSREQHPTAYRLVIRVAGAPVGGARRFSLHPGETTTLGFTAPAESGPTVPVIASLFKEGRSGAYRRVSTWIASPGEAG